MTNNRRYVIIKTSKEREIKIMTNINEYLNNILNTNGFDTYAEEDDKLWELYERDDDSFWVYCEENKIDLDAQQIIMGLPTDVLDLWVWDHCE